MAITRRQFLKRSGVAAGAMASAGLFTNPLVRRAFAEIDDKYLVVIFLDGGNDGLNTVVPSGNANYNLRDAYQAARTLGPGGLQLSSGQLAGTSFGTDANTATPIALHPGLSGLKYLQTTYNKVAVIQGCGYPDYNLSHEVSRQIWQTGYPFSPIQNGWVGRHLHDQYTLMQIPAVCVSNSIAPEFRTTGTNVLAISRLSNFRFPYDRDHNPDNLNKDDAFNLLYGAAEGSAHALSKVVGSVGKSTLLATQSYRSLAGDWNSARSDTIKNSYIDSINDYGSGIATRLREVSRMIYGVETGATGVDCHFFQLSNGGYDTHSDQGTNGANEQHYGLHRELGDAIKVFYEDMIDLGTESRVCIVVWSEFSRRIEQNDSGTDHGSQGPMFVVGGAVNGGLYGNHPDIRANSLDDQGNTNYTQSSDPSDAFVSTDFRDVFGTILLNWVDMDLGDVQALLPTDPFVDPDHYWLTQNFNMGFL